MRPAQVWISLTIALAMLCAPGALAADKALEVIFGAWGKVDQDPKARGCRSYTNRVDGDYFVMSKGYIKTGGDCVCILEGSRPASSCFDVNLFCRCEDGITVRRRYQTLCPTGRRSRLDVTEDGETIAYERCRNRR